MVASSFPPMEPPNGERVTNAVLYKALYEFQGAMLHQFGLLDERFNGIAERACIVERRLDEHEKQPHLSVKLIAGLIAGALSAFLVALVDCLKRMS